MSSQCNLVPVRDFLVVEKDEPAKQSAGGIFLTAPADEKVISARVVAVGSGTIVESGERVPMEVKQGDRVIFVKSLSVEVKEGDKTFLLLREEHVMCRVQE